MFKLFFPAQEVIKENRSWLIMAAVIFMACTTLFYLTASADMDAVEQSSVFNLEQFENLFSLIIDSGPLIAIALIFMNNFLSMAQMLLLGVLAGLSPLVTLAFNGALVGVLLSLSVQEGVFLLPLIAFGLMPHGIFDLFAFFLCAALGLKFGYHCIAFPLPGKTRLQSYRYIWKEAISILPLVVLLLLIAAVIEMKVTPFLLELVL